MDESHRFPAPIVSLTEHRRARGMVPPTTPPGRTWLVSPKIWLEVIAGVVVAMLPILVFAGLVYDARFSWTNSQVPIADLGVGVIFALIKLDEQDVHTFHIFTLVSTVGLFLTSVATGFWPVPAGIHIRDMGYSAQPLARPSAALTRALQSPQWADLRVIRTLQLRVTTPPASAADPEGTRILAGVLRARPHTRWRFHLAVPKTLAPVAFYLRRDGAGGYAFYIGRAEQRKVRYSAKLQRQMLVAMRHVVQAYRQHQQQPARQARSVASWH